MIKNSNRKHLADKLVSDDISGGNYSNYLMERVAAKGKKFESVNFQYTIFDTCYFRRCVFVKCNFTGCRFIGCNFNGASFIGCTFDYSFFEKTTIDSSILDNCCPGFDNLKMRFARTLRMNFQEIGDAVAVNKAISVELAATENALLKSWNSNESYYREKYIGFERVLYFLRYLEFKFLDFVWGNGESLYKLFRATALILLFIAIKDAFVRHDPLDLRSYWTAVSASPQLFLGTILPKEYSTGYLSFIHFTRLIILGLFMTILIKRFNRR
nr:pentapeptide repeat-containing protein [uncultured Pseudodesulfovibrio sp.]